jgi:hypothetical protein
MSYPELEKQQAMLDAVNRRLKASQEQGELSLQLSFNDVLALAEELRMPQAEGVAIFRRLYQEGFFGGWMGQGYKDPVIGSVPFSRVKVEFLTSKGKQEIGDFPDPRERIILGVEAAIRSLQRDPTMDPAEKQRKIDWFEEFKFVVRSLTVETAKAVFRGDASIF